MPYAGFNPATPALGQLNISASSCAVWALDNWRTRKR